LASFFGGAHKPRWIFVLALAAMLGALRYNLAQPHFDHTSLATYNDQQKSVIVEGLVVSEPDMRDTYTSLRVEADHLFISNFPDPHRKRRCSPAFCWATMRRLAGGNLPRPPQERARRFPRDGHVPYHAAVLSAAISG
jgi:hypothetical protein